MLHLLWKLRIVELLNLHISQSDVPLVNEIAAQINFPVSLRWGYRSPIDHFFIDFCAGVSYIPFESGFGCAIVDDRTEVELFNNFSFNFNIAIGLGWAD